MAVLNGERMHDTMERLLPGARSAALLWQGAAVLGGAKIAACAEAGKQAGTVHAQSEYRSRRNTDGSAQADEKQRYLGASANQVAAFQQAADVRMPHAFHAWVVNRVIDDPVVNGLALSQRVLDASNGAFGCST